MDGGTLYHLRNVINWKNVVKDPTNNLTACEEFFLLVVEAHILTATMSVFGMKTIEDRPSNTLFPEGATDLNFSEGRVLLMTGIDVEEVC